MQSKFEYNYILYNFIFYIQWLNFVETIKMGWIVKDISFIA